MVAQKAVPLVAYSVVQKAVPMVAPTAARWVARTVVDWAVH